MGVSPGVIAVAMEDGDAGDRRGGGVRGVVAELRLGGGDEAGLGLDDWSIASQ
jgi:hypothetical protein